MTGTSEDVVTTPVSLAAALGGWLRDARSLAESVGATALVAELDALAESRRQAGFRVAVVGEFNRGKSTLVNRLIGHDLLPTGPVPCTRGFVEIAPGEDACLTVRWPDDRVERRDAGPGMWDGLVSDPVDPPAGEPPRLALAVPGTWLADADTQLVDTPGTNESVEDRLLDVRRAVTLSDGVVLVVSAAIPLSRTERQLLEQEVLRRAVPFVVVVVTFLDQVPAAERATTLASIRAKVHQMAPDTPVLPGPWSEQDTARLADIRRQLGIFAAHNNNRTWRSRRLAVGVADVCAAVADVATTAAATATLADDEREAELVRERAALDQDVRGWAALRVELDSRRRDVAGRVRALLRTGTEAIAEALHHDLLRAPDPRRYWDEEAPYRLRRELIVLTRECESVVLAGMSDDVAWLDQTLATQFGVSGGLPIPQPNLVVPTVARPEPVVPDLARRRLLSRIGVTGGSIVGYVLGGIVSVALPPVAIGLATGLVAGLVAERSLQGAVEQQREIVDTHLRTLVDGVIDTFADHVAGQLAHRYAELVDTMAALGAAWRAARLDALTGPPSSAAPVAAVAAAATKLADTIRAAVAADTPTLTEES